MPSKYFSSWSSCKLNVMWKGLEAKFRQNPELSRELLRTGVRRIFYDDADIFWGKRMGTVQKKGLNYFGRLLVGLREKFSKEALGEEKVKEKIDQEEVDLVVSDVTAEILDDFYR